MRRADSSQTAGHLRRTAERSQQSETRYHEGSKSFSYPLVDFATGAVWIRRRLGGRKLLLLLALLLAGFPHTPAQAQQVASSVGAQDLAKSAHNPFEDFVKLPFEATTGFGIGPHHNAGEGLNIEPQIPFRLTPQWDLIAEPSLTLTYMPSPHEQFGLQDLQTSFFLTPHGADVWLWGIGPIFQFPTATTTGFATCRWSAGPTAALIYSRGPWFNGVLAYQLVSFAGDRNRGSIDQTFIEPELSYNFESGWYIDWNPSITFDWTANAANGWTVPMGADVGKALSIGTRSLSLQIGAYDLVERPAGTPQWIIRVQLTLLFPR
jgi:hypothetical protein